MQIVAGLSLKNLKPRVWDSSSPYYLPHLPAVMVSYADFSRMRGARCAAMEQGLHAYLRVPRHVKIYLDNGAFYFLERNGETPREAYEEFVERAQPDWWPIPQDFIPTPKMTFEEQQSCFDRTMQMNLAYQYDGYVPVVHISRFLEAYTSAFTSNNNLSIKSAVALGGIVPNLLRASKAIPYQEIIRGLKHVRQIFSEKRLHVFGIGGTSTLHIAALLGVDSVDSTGWRNRAARGLIQLPGTGDRVVAELGKWRGRRVNEQECEKLLECLCPACQQYGLAGLQARGIDGACNRSTHNLWVLLEEARLIEEHLANETYHSWYKTHLDNSIYLPLIEQLVT